MGKLRIDLVASPRFKDAVPWVLIRMRVGNHGKDKRYNIHRTCDVTYCKLEFGQEFDTTNKFDQWFKGDNELAKVRNLDLRKTISELQATYVTLCGKSVVEPTALEVREAWKSRVPEKPPAKLLEFFATYCQEKEMEPNTAKTYDSAMKSVKEFLRIKCGVTDDNFLVDQVDSTFIYRYEHFMAKAVSPVTGKKFEKGTASIYLSKLKAILSHAFHSGVIKANVAKDHKWTGVLKDDTKVASADVITEAVMWKIPKESLHKIETLQLEGNAVGELGRTRLLFLLQTFTGLAYADLCELKDVKVKIRLDLNGTKSLCYNRAKNGELAIVPILPQTEKLLEVLEYDATPQTSYDTMHRKMKALMRYYVVPVKDDEIGTHTGRHLFGTRMIHMGFSMHMVSRMMGHTSLKETEKTYARVDITAINADWDRVKILQQPTGERLAI